MRCCNGDEEQAMEAADDGTSTSSLPLPPPPPPPSPSSFLPPLNLRAAALRSQEDNGCFPLCGTRRPANWEQSSPEELAWGAEVAAATAHLPPPSRLLPREATAALVARAVGGGGAGESGEGGEAAALRRLKERLDDAGLRVPTVFTSWQNLSVCRRRGRGGSGGRERAPSYPSLVSPFLSVANDVSSALMALFSGRCRREEAEAEEEEARGKRDWLRVLDDSTGVLLPGTTTLLLGPPGSGKTTLLRALSGRLKPGRGVRVSGADRVLYNGARAGDGRGFSLPRTVAYVGASDRHLPTLTVRETLRFAEECHGGDPTIRPLLESLVTVEERRSASKSGRDAALDSLMAALCNPSNSAATEWVLRVLRLSRAADTAVGGDALHRGVSGGERRRTSTGELIVGAARALCLDEISTGLDSSSTAALARSLRSSARDLGVAVLAALLAPEPDAVAAFDDVLLLSSGGRTLYHGGIDEAFAYFGSLGLFPLSGRQDVADFLLDVARPEGRRLLWEAAGKENERRGSSRPRPPPSTSAMAAAFRASEIGKRLAAAAARPFPRTPETDAELCRGSFAAPRLALLGALLRRAAKVDLLSADGASAAATRWLLALLMSLAVGSLFLNLPVTLEGGQARLAVLFFALFFVVTLAVPAIEVAHGRKPVVLRQRDDGFYPVRKEDRANGRNAAVLRVVLPCATDENDGTKNSLPGQRRRKLQNKKNDDRPGSTSCRRRSRRSRSSPSTCSPRRSRSTFLRASPGAPRGSPPSSASFLF